MFSTLRKLSAVCLFLLIASPVSAQRVLYNISSLGENIVSDGVHWVPPVVSGAGNYVTSAEVRAQYPHRYAGTFSRLGVNVYDGKVDRLYSVLIVSLLDV